MAWAVIIVMDNQRKQQTYEEIYGTTRANMSTVMNEEVRICCKSVTAQVFTLVGLLVELSIVIKKSNGSLEASPYIRYTYVMVTSPLTKYK